MTGGGCTNVDPYGPEAGNDGGRGDITVVSSSISFNILSTAISTSSSVTVLLVPAVAADMITWVMADGWMDGWMEGWMDGWI